ncbi:MAG: hypothetical protein H6R17_1675 [Proteobacteria bacterium]|nr:hypothetical protein [Pseudomonadota bacterium]
MKRACLLAAMLLAIAGCASAPQADCCSGVPEVIYVDKSVAECTRSVQRVTQTNPCASCERFPVSARFDGGCSVGEALRK